MLIEVCLGSACHEKGGNRVFLKLRQIIREKNLSDKIILKGSMCLGHCGEPGANIRIDGKVYSGLTIDNIDEFVNKNILTKL